MSSHKFHNNSNNNKLCEAIDCNQIASTQVEFKVKNNILMNFQVCSKCKKKFFMNKWNIKDV
jgi:hypothetical protein